MPEARRNAPRNTVIDPTVGATVLGPGASGCGLLPPGIGGWLEWLGDASA